MLTSLDLKMIDTGVFVTANLINLLLIGIFLCRPKQMDRLEYILGLILICLAIPVAMAVVYNLLNHRDWWTVVLPSVFMLYAFIELLLDYLLKSNFRETALLWPYLVLLYLSLWGMIGFSFLVNKTYGFVTLSTYFLNLMATWYSYAKVGHG